MEVGIEAGEHLRLLPGQGVDAQHGLPVELHQRGPAIGVDAAEGVDAEALHRPVRARDAPVRHVPDRVVLTLGVQRDEVPERVVRALRLRDLAVRVRLGRVDHVGELDAVLDEEDRDVVADEVEGALVGVELRREAPGVSDGVGRAAGPQDGREADEDRGLRALREEAGDRHVVRGAVALEDAVRAGAAGVHDPLGDALVVEVGDLLAQVVVLEQSRPARAGLQRVVAVAQPDARLPWSGRRPAAQRPSGRRPAPPPSASGGQACPGRAWAAAVHAPRWAPPAAPVQRPASLGLPARGASRQRRPPSARPCPPLSWPSSSRTCLVASWLLSVLSPWPPAWLTSSLAAWRSWLTSSLGAGRPRVTPVVMGRAGSVPVATDRLFTPAGGSVVGMDTRTDGTSPHRGCGRAARQSQGSIARSSLPWPGSR